MKKLILILFLVPLGLYAKREEGDRCALEGYIKVVVNHKDTIPATDLPVLIVDGEFYFDEVDALGYFNISIPKKDSVELKIVGWGYEVQKYVSSKSPAILFGNVICEVTADVAVSDIEKGNPRLLIIGGIAPVANYFADKRFESKFNVKYFIYDCSVPIIDCVEAYNRIVFQFLDEKYGSEWRLWVRKDVEGL